MQFCAVSRSKIAWKMRMKQPGTNALRSEERTKIAALPMRVRSIAARTAGSRRRRG